ncbi:MAG: hypothetical protein NC191_07885 [Muribaculaceae bacterium]|nr:hypothetical protein [Muribaculaceae bacterium]
MLKFLLNKIKIITNPLLYYVDKSGNSVFRNYCLFKNTGCLYKTTIPKKNAGKTLELRFELDKILKRIYIFTPIVLYLIFIHVQFSLASVLWFELLWLGIICGSRIAASCIYSRHLTGKFGVYEMIDFRPALKKSKYREFFWLYVSKIVSVALVVILLFVPSLLLKYSIKLDITRSSNFKQAVKLSKVYFAFYPKDTKIYDMRAYAKFKMRDYEGALEDYITVLNLSGKKFQKEDTVRLANLLYLKRFLATPGDAIELFDEYSTKKVLPVLEASKLLWIKSNFCIENNLTESIAQDYDDLISSLDSKDYENQFYIASDKAYLLYLMREYQYAIEVYNPLIAYAAAHGDKYSDKLKALYVERGFAKLKLGDTKSADDDFLLSGITPFDIKKYEPYSTTQVFISDYK